jgi:nucleoid-associated protein YgaU
VEITTANDTLSSLALKFYGDGSANAWKKILDANPDMLKGNAGNIKAGMELYIPPLP